MVDALSIFQNDWKPLDTEPYRSPSGIYEPNVCNVLLNDIIFNINMNTVIIQIINRN